MLRASLARLQKPNMPRPRPVQPLIAVIGATGTGKSQLAVDLACRFDGEIVNGDAMQLYDGLPIVTNKIPLEERNGVPHHLLGCIELQQEPWRVDRFVPEALRVIRDIHARGKLPILVGGTHYYTQSLLFKDVLAGATDAGAEPTTTEDEDAKEAWPILTAPLPDVLAKLRQVDPTMAQRWHPNDDRKIRRSLEIYLKTGKRASDVYEEQRLRKQTAIQRSASDEANEDFEIGPGLLRYPTLLIWTYTPREALNDRLNQRVEKMIEQGLLDELRSMDSFIDQEHHAVDKSKGIWVAIGYKEFREYMTASKNPNATEAELHELRAAAVEKTKKATRDYAKAQIKWIRIKLINSLRDSDASHFLFLVDTSDPEDWSTSILPPAIEWTRKFLQGSPLPDPAQESDLAREMLVPKREYDLSQRSDLWAQRTCELCNTTLVTQNEWERHLKSRSHRSLLKKAAKKKRRGGTNDVVAEGALGDSATAAEEDYNLSSVTGFEKLDVR